jgi:hypothetical protein
MKSLISLMLVLLLLPGCSRPSQPEPASPSGHAKKLHVVVFGAHPDDPESGCGGLIALLTKGGHEVIVAYATCFRGDRKIGTEAEGIVRRREATAACRVLGAKPHFFDYAHESLQADEPTLKAVSAWLRKVQPDIVVTHWPLDTHPNHHVTSSLVWQSYLQGSPWMCFYIAPQAPDHSLCPVNRQGLRRGQRSPHPCPRSDCRGESCPIPPGEPTTF